MFIPSMDSGEAITDAPAFLRFATAASRRAVPALPAATCAILHRGSSEPTALCTSDERPAVRAALGDLGRLTEIDCGVGVGISFGYPGRVSDVLAGGVDLDRAFGPFSSGSPRTIVTFFACVLDDRSVVESFRFVECADGCVREVAPREEMALTLAFIEAGDLAVASLRAVLGERRAAPLPDVYAPLLERIGSRARAYLERAVEAREIFRADPGAVCESADAGLPCSSGPLYAVSGDAVDPSGDLDRARCANHLVPMLETASSGLVRLGIASAAWFAERAAGVLVTAHCPACDALRTVPVVVTDRRTVSRERADSLGLGRVFVRFLTSVSGARVTESRSCCDLAARSRDLLDRVARNEFGADLRLAWTCDLRAFVTRGERAAGLRLNLAGCDASDLFDFCALRAPRFDILAFS